MYETGARILSNVRKLSTLFFVHLISGSTKPFVFVHTSLMVARDTRIRIARARMLG